MAKRYIATERDAMELRRIVRKVDTLNGDGVINRREQITIAAQSSKSAQDIATSSKPRRLKIKTAADANGVAVCNSWDGTTQGTTDIPVRMSVGKGKVSEELWAQACSPNAGVTFSGANVVWIEVVVGETASPTSLAPTGSTADTTTWSIQSDGTPLSLTFMARVAYDTTAHKLYGYNRTAKFDTKGRLFELSAETRVDVDAAESCP